MPDAPHIVFSHGKESGPWGTKISRMAELLKLRGLTFDSLDYQGMDEPQPRIDKLVAHCRGGHKSLLLVGSSMGSYVSLAAAEKVQPAGLFLLAPAVYMPGYDAPLGLPPGCHVEVVHGWRDDVVPVQNGIRFAREHQALLHVLDSDHRLTDSLEYITHLFGLFLARFSA
ncbi:MAG: alpha/beta hydrolase [Gammaproteobacteria bacterium]|jgi:hypothetical protein